MEKAEVKTLCRDIMTDYEAGEMDKCLDGLTRLGGGSRGEKVHSHVQSAARDLNRALAVFAKSGWKNVKQYRSALYKLAPEAKGGPFSSENGSSPETDDLTRAYIFFNLAVLCYNSNQYKSALGFLHKLRSVPYTKDELKISALIMEMNMTLLLQEPDRTLVVAEELEKLLSKSTHSSKSIPIKKLNRYRLQALLMLRKLEIIAVSISPKQDTESSLIRSHYQYLTSAGNSSDIPTLSKQLTESIAHDLPTEGRISEHLKRMILHNNIGCTYGSRQKHNLALLHFQKSQAEMKSDEGQSALSSLPAPWKLSIMYNMGLSLLKGGQPQPAFELFLSVVRHYPNNPRLWLRLAECCLVLHQTPHTGAKRIVKDVIGIGPHRKAILNPNSSRCRVEPLGGTGAIPALSLEFAFLCVKNCLTLLPEVKQEDLLEDHRAAQSASSPHPKNRPEPQVPALPGPPLSLSEIHRVRCSALGAGAEIALSLGETQTALEYAHQLRNLPLLSPVHQCLWRLFAGEAFVTMEGYNGALEMLDPTKIVQLDPADFWKIKEAEHPDLRAKIVYNLALCCAMQGEYGPAAEVLSKVKVNPDTPVEPLLLSLFIQIKKGKLDYAKKVVMDQIPALRSLEQ